MAFNTKLIYCETKDQFQKQLDAKQITDTSIVFIKSTGELWTHGKLFAGNFVSKDSNKIALTLGGSSVELSKAGHTHSYLPLRGGTLTGALNFANNTWNKLGDDAYIGDHNVGNHLCIKAISGTTAGIAFFNSSDGAIGKLASANNTLQWNGTSISLSNHNHDDRYVNITGDIMTGNLSINKANPTIYLTSGQQEYSKIEFNHSTYQNEDWVGGIVSSSFGSAKLVGKDTGTGELSGNIHGMGFINARSNFGGWHFINKNKEVFYIHYTGDVKANAGFMAYASYSDTNSASHKLDINNCAFRNTVEAYVNHNSSRSMLGWYDTVSGYGYRTRYVIGSERGNSSGWGKMYLAVGNNDSGTSIGCNLALQGNGWVIASGAMEASRFCSGYDSGQDSSFNCSNWFRSSGSSGWLNATYGGGWYMTDNAYIRTFNNKAIVAVRYDADQGLSGSGWNTGHGAFSVRIHNNSNQTPILVAYRNGTNDTGANRLFALELLNSGSQLAFGMGGTHVATLNNKSELTASLFIGNLSGYASSAGVLHLQGETGSSTGTSLPNHVGMELYQYYNSGNGPTTYGNFLKIRGNNGGCGELFLGWQGDNNTSGIWYKSKRDVGSWGAWRQVAFTDSNVASADQAIVAEYLSPHYAGGVQTNPQTYFSNSTGVKVAMTGVGGMGSYWTDTLWINGHSGGDVKGMCALHFSKQNGPRFSISYQNHDNSFYGTCYEVWTSYNFNPSSVVSDNIKWAMYKVTIGSSSVSYSKMSGNHNFISGSSKLGMGSATLSLSYPSGASKTSIMMSATGHHAGSDWNRIVYASLQPDYGISNQIKLMLGDDSTNNDGGAIITFMYVG